MLSLLLLIFTVSFSSFAAENSASKYSYPTQKISLRGVTDIKITGINGRLNMRGRGRSASLNLRVQHSKSARYEDWHLEVERRGHTLFLEVFNVAYGSQWNKQVRKELWPEFDIDLDGPSLPTTISWREGPLQISNWNAPLEVTYLKGKAEVSGGQGDLNLQPVDGEVKITHHKGKVLVKGESGAIALNESSGDADLNLVRGTMTLKNDSGKMHLEAQKGEVDVSRGQGQLTLQVGTGRVRISSYKGQISGQGDASNWELTNQAPDSVNVVTQSGAVHLKWKGGGRVFLSSNQGQIKIEHSEFLSVIRKNGAQVAQGLLTERVMGDVFVQTRSGAISWRQ